VAVRARPERGAANLAVLELLRSRLGLPAAALRWRRAGRGAAKELEVTGLSELEVARRLGAAAREPA